MRYPFFACLQPRAERSLLLPDNEASVGQPEGKILLDNEGVFVKLGDSVNTLVDEDAFDRWVRSAVLAHKDTLLFKVLPHLVVDRNVSNDWKLITLDVLKGEDDLHIRVYETPLMAVPALSVVEQPNRTLITWMGSGLAVQDAIQALSE